MVLPAPAVFSSRRWQCYTTRPARLPAHYPNRRDFPVNAGKNSQARGSQEPPVCRHILRKSALHVLLAMQKVEGSNPFSRFRRLPCNCRFFTKQATGQVARVTDLRWTAVGRLRGIGLSLAALAGAALAVPANAQTPNATLPSQCSDQQVAPVRVIITCGDGGVIAHDLVWSNWGAAQAQATGQFRSTPASRTARAGGARNIPLN
jgi:hypothetical protein